jgi:hypothetical protein
MLLRTARYAKKRRGVILMVVLALLTLFAILGLSFVFYSDAEATSARIFREAQNLSSGDPTDVSTYWAMWLGQFLYDLNDDNFGVMSAMRGHSLGRTMYGWNDPNNGAAGAYALNDTPYCGTGRLSEALPSGIDGQQSINYTSYSGDGFLRDPGRPGTRANTAAARNPIVGDLNPSYTYPDANNVFLAMMDPTGKVQVPSYHRPWLFNPTTGLNDQTNANWTSAAGKYLLMRPRPNEMDPTFPFPTDAVGDVKNLDWAPGGNDSVWIDFNAPVLTLADGTQVKVLAAPLVIDLDGRINLNVHGNILGNAATTQGLGTTHVSNQGWGPWETSLPLVLDAAANPTEWLNVFNGSGTTYGRYGPGKAPIGSLPNNNFSGGSMPRAYYPMDYNSVTDSSPYAPSSPAWSFPGAGTNLPYLLFPNYPAGNYGNAAPLETPNHPSIFNPMRPLRVSATSYNQTFGPRDLGAMLQRASIGGDTLSSNLMTLLSNNLVGTGIADAAAMQRRGRVTTMSFDMDRPGVTPFIWDPTTAPYTYNGAIGGYPVGGANPFPAIATAQGAPPAGSEFDANTKRSLLAALKRIDLGRQLSNYPTPDTTSATPTYQFLATDMAKVKQAVLDRQALATDIFTVFLNVTGVGTVSSATVGSTQYNAMRYLAQLAVNIVDFIDNDDYITPFLWDPTNNGWVFGTELPRVVINEYYAQWDNDPTDILPALPAYKAKVNNRVNLWVELFNGFPTDAADPQNGTVRLHNGTNPVYQLTVVQAGATNLTKIRNADNVMGTPDTPVAAASIVSTWGNGTANAAVTTVIKPGAGSYSGASGSNAGFYVVGPAIVANQYTAPLDVSDPKLTSTYQDSALTFTIPVANNPTVLTGGDFRPALLLQRLANPYLPPQPVYDPANPQLYNPYITIDYVERVRVDSNLNANGNDARVFDVNGNNANNVPVAQRQAWGRQQPFAAYFNQTTNSQWKGQAPMTALTTSPQHTFYRHNAVEDAPGPPVQGTAGQTLTVPFDVQYHPDRQLLSVADLLHVSGFKPHEFTQQFVDSNGNRFGHRAPWSDQNSLLLRAWEFLTIGGRINGPAVAGRIPGKVNINTVWDPTVFLALCDAQAANQFTAAQVNAIWTALIAQRSPDTSGGQPVSGANSQPYWGLATGMAAGGDPLGAASRGINNTLLRSSTGASTATDVTQLRMFEPNQTLPAQPLSRFELLSKIMQNLTTRSNVFGVWVTFGFFKVTDSTTQPVKLGAEYIWPNVGTTIRHKMFALVDRTQLQVWPTLNSNNQPMLRSQSAISLPTGPPPGTSVVAPIQLMDASGNTTTTVTNPNTSRTWTIQAGAIITIDPDTDNEETVVVQAGGATGFQATFFKNHAVGAIIISRGNPGPWSLYDPARDGAVVPYTASIN